MHAVILERNKLVGRKVARLFLSVGATAVTVEEPSQAIAALENADVLRLTEPRSGGCTRCAPSTAGESLRCHYAFGVEQEETEITEK